MKSNHWLLCGLVAMTPACVWSQAVVPAPRAPAAGVAFAKDVVLDPPAQATVKGEPVHVRGEPSLAGDALTNLSRGETVTVFEQLTLAKPKPGEPTNWSRIALPANTPVWVFADYVNTNTMTVSTRLNVRAGPSEAFNVVARLDKGTPVTEVRRAGGWIQIVPPTNAFGFVASEYLVLQTPPAPPAPPPVAPPPAVTVPAEPVATPAPPVEPAPAEATNTPPPVVAETPVVAPAPAAPEPVAPPPGNSVPPPAPPPPPAPVATGDELKPRVVTREGFVRRALNVQAPTDYQLIDIRSGALTEYLLSNDKNFKVYLGARVSVTGPEMLDSRWPKTPVLQVQTIDLLP